MHFTEDTIQTQKKLTHYNSLYDIYQKSFYTIKKGPANMYIEHGVTHTMIHIPYRIPRGVLQKQIIFAEIEFLERYYESISFFMTSTISIDVTLPKRVLVTNTKKKDSAPWIKIKRATENKRTIYLPEKMTFILSHQYPFVTPYVYINETPYLQKINCCHLARVKHIVCKYTSVFRPHLNCISCGSVMNHWKACYRFSHIIKELQMIQRFREITKYEIVLGELIYHKNLDDDILFYILSFIGIEVDADL